MGKFDSRRILDTNIRSFDLIRFKSEGVTPYYYDKKTLTLTEFTKPLTSRDMELRPREVFLLTQDEYDKVFKLSENIKKLIELELQKIETLKQFVPATMAELVKRE